MKVTYTENLAKLLPGVGYQALLAKWSAYAYANINTRAFCVRMRAFAERQYRGRIKFDGGNRELA